MATAISVTVAGPLGLDESDQMVADLTQATGVSWQARTVDSGRVLGIDVVEIVLTAVIGTGVQMTADAMVDTVKDLVRRWRAERLDPPEMVVETETTPDGDRTDDLDG